MSPTRIFRWLGSAVILLALAAPADAGRRVDWSAYIDRDAQRAAREPKAESTPTARESRASKKKQKKIAKQAKAKKVTKARKKKARRK